MQSASGGNHGSRSWRMGLCAEPASAPLFAPWEPPQVGGAFPRPRCIAFCPPYKLKTGILFFCYSLNLINFFV
ncbi:hypothetical protein [Moorena producens]|uniref:hypothetical protein n=1 Tax=Moorena producens TaxID=1155739 RepID=UPI0011EA632F|nr:hypothetical protein [Moorena producens]